MSALKLREIFPAVTSQEWEEAIRKDLKGADFTKRLVWQTDEGIAVKPFYRSEDLRGLEYLDSLPGEFPYTRGTRASNDWRVRQRIAAPDAEEARRLAEEALATGVDEIAFELGQRSFALHSVEEVAGLLEGLPCPVHFEAGEAAPALLLLLMEALRGRTGFEGSLDYDPFTGANGASLERAVQSIRELVGVPGFRPVTVRAHLFQNFGGNIVEELGFALAAGIEYMVWLTSNGLTTDEAASCIVFSFAAGSNLFFEIAKLRATRMLWARAVDAFHPASLDSTRARIHAGTSLWNKTIYDSHLNILRATTEVMSAALGGCDSLEVAPFDLPYAYSGSFPRRLAVNTQLVLKHEALLNRVVDPAGGSYYVETLTDAIARESWRIVQELESGGGFRKAWVAGQIAARLEKSRAAKLADFSARKRALVGTNQYPNLSERMLEKIERKPEDRITPRAAEVFESIRLRSERHAASGGRLPRFLLVEIGDQKMSKARSNFVTNFFGCAGFEIQTVSCTDAACAVQCATEAKPDAVVLCSSDQEYPAIAPPFLKGLSQNASGVPVIVAGYPKDSIEQLKQAGIADFVHIRSNAAEVLAAWQKRLGIEG